MSVPTTAAAVVTIDAPPGVVFDLVSDVTRMGEWSPECHRCEWQDEPGAVGSRFKGHNRNGLLRWTTTAVVDAADRPRRFAFHTVWRGGVSTRWSYELEGDGPTTVTERFEAVSSPKLIELYERYIMRGRQAELEEGMARTLAAVKAIAESA
jgi:uncharacterized protein YndB with AHSA1/START domain